MVVQIDNTDDKLHIKANNLSYECELTNVPAKDKRDAFLTDVEQELDFTNFRLVHENSKLERYRLVGINASGGYNVAGLDSHYVTTIFEFLDSIE
jgi:hypothetical protein